MPVKLSYNEVVDRLTKLTYSLEGEYYNTKVPTLLKCNNGHLWNAILSHVFSGSGCPHCNGNAKLTKEIINERLKHKNIRIIGDYINALTKASFECERGHVWTTTPNNLFKNDQPCPYCSEYLLDSDIINARIEHKHIKMIGNYTGALIKTKFKCNADHEWYSTPAHVMYDSGCPSCSNHGFNPSLEAYAYIIVFDTFVKYGITNYLEQRLEQHRRTGDFRIHKTKFFKNGLDARIWENDIKTTFGGKYVTKEQCADGWTETLVLDLLEDVTNTLQNIYGDFSDNNC